MSDSTDKGEKKLTLSGRKTLQLKKTVDAGQVRQSLSHGRGKSVVVERKRRRSRKGFDPPRTGRDAFFVYEAETK